MWKETAARLFQCTARKARRLGAPLDHLCVYIGSQHQEDGGRMVELFIGQPYVVEFGPNIIAQHPNWCSDPQIGVAL